jgi:hypothetical protein
VIAIERIGALEGTIGHRMGLFVSSAVGQTKKVYLKIGASLLYLVGNTALLLLP